MIRRSKVFAVLLTIGFIFQAIPVSATNQIQRMEQKASFTDVTNDYWANESIKKIAEAGIINGYPDGTFRPEGTVTRAEFVAIINGVMGYNEGVVKTSFKDIKKEAWYYKSLLIAEKQGYIAGFSDGTFKPNDKITKEQVCVIVSRVTGIVELPGAILPKDEIAEWSKPSVLKVLSNRLMILDEKGNFLPKQHATRGLVADVMGKFLIENKTQRTLNKKEKEFKDRSLSPSSDDVSVNSDLNQLSGDKEKSNIDSNKPSVDTNKPSVDMSKPSVDTNKPSEKESSENDEKQKKINQQARTVADNLRDSLSEFKTDAERDVANDIIRNMESYIADKNHDYKSAVDSVREKYNSLSEEEKKDLKKIIQLNNKTDDLIDLKEQLF